MPLTRATVTIASRVMLPAYVIFSAGVGLSFIITPLHRLREAPTTRHLDNIVGIRVVGLVLLCVAVALLVAIILRYREGAVVAVGALGVWCVAYSVAAFVAAFAQQSSFSAFLWSALIATACWATMLSLTADEVS